MLIFLVRHAEARPGEPDDLRSLSEEGRRQAVALGDRLAPRSPATIRTSPLLRARETGAAIARPCRLSAEADVRLAPGATADGVRALVAESTGPLVVVGHQPDCGRIAAELLGGPEPAFPPTGCVEIEL